MSWAAQHLCAQSCECMGYFLVSSVGVPAECEHMVLWWGLQHVRLVRIDAGGARLQYMVSRGVLGSAYV